MSESHFGFCESHHMNIMTDVRTFQIPNIFNTHAIGSMRVCFRRCRYNVHIVKKWITITSSNLKNGIVYCICINVEMGLSVCVLLVLYWLSIHDPADEVFPRLFAFGWTTLTGRYHAEHRSQWGFFVFTFSWALVRCCFLNALFVFVWEILCVLVILCIFNCVEAGSQIGLQLLMMRIYDRVGWNEYIIFVYGRRRCCGCV